VMQGSVLGPLLFLCFINDLNNASDLFKLLFADDTCALHSDSNLASLVQHINAEVRKIAIWFASNKLVVNVKKCRFILFHNKGKKIDTNVLNVVFDLNENNAIHNPDLIFKIERVSNGSDEKSYKYLGVLLDEHLNFNMHVDYVCNKLSRSLFCLNRLKNFVRKKALVQVYHALFNSHLLYCINVLGATSLQNIKRISIMQKKAIRIICNLNYNAHTAEHFYDLGILPFEKLLVFNRALFMHSVRYNYVHRSFSNTWTLNDERNLNYNLRNVDEFAITPPRFEGFKKFPIYSFPNTWNGLDEVKMQRNRVTFKIELKTKLLNSLIFEDV
jgi:Reverse transcriptase (RNA-dependent DNA polymerase)